MPPYIWTPHTFGQPHMSGNPYMFGHPSYNQMPPVCLNTPTHLYAPMLPVHLYVSRGYLHMIWGWRHPNIWGPYEHMGAYECMVVYGCPLSLTAPLPMSKVGTSYLKLNSYT